MYDDEAQEPEKSELVIKKLNSKISDIVDYQLIGKDDHDTVNTLVSY